MEFFLHVVVGGNFAFVFSLHLFWSSHYAASMAKKKLGENIIDSKYRGTKVNVTESSTM